LLQKSFWGDDRKFLEPLVRFARGDVRETTSFHPKSITGLRGGAKERRSRSEAQRSTFARCFGLFDFRLLQQYLRKADVTVALMNVRFQGKNGPRSLAV
jgi:hypothetical protein